MTKPRSSSDRILLGVLGRLSRRCAVLKDWNAALRGLGIDGSMDAYPCTVSSLPERLSEMMHFDRRGYIVAPDLQRAIIRYLDRLDASASDAGAVDTVFNDGGVLIGFFAEDDTAHRKRIWMFA
ncbi:hypothetical protein FJZ27_02450 [Candidatus Peribacteria bacterium]|nr:hypothetical protein [Candidatus Peribacteria bacterium]